MATCPHCGKELEGSLGLPGAVCKECRQVAAAWWSAVGGSRLLVTPALIAANVLVFVVMVTSGVSLLSPSPDQALRWGASFGPLTLDHGWWRLVSSTFVHYGVVHLALNMWCLWSVGDLAERMFGRWPFLASYLLTGVAGGLLSLLVHPMVVSAGASGAVFGVAGALVGFLFKGALPLGVPGMGKRLSSLLTFVGYNLLYGLGKSGIDNAAHAGGLAVGVAIGVLAGIGFTLDDAPPRGPWLWITAGSVLALTFLASKVERVQAHVVELGAAGRLLDAGRFEEAIPRLQALTARKPTLAAAHDLLGDAYTGVGRGADAIAGYERAVTLDSTNATFRFDVGAAYLRAERFEEAVAAFTRVLQLAPREAAAHLNLARAFGRSGRYDDAIRSARQAVTLRPRDPETYLVLGWAHMGKKEYGTALADFDSAVARNPDFDLPYYNRALIHLERGERAAAQADFRRFLELANDDTSREVQFARRQLDALDALPRGLARGRALFNDGRYADATTAFRSVERDARILAIRYPDDLEVRHLYAESRDWIGRVREACRAEQIVAQRRGATAPICN